MESLRTSDKAAARACRAADLQNLCHIISSYKLELKPIKAFPLGFQTRSGFLVVIRFFPLWFSVPNIGGPDYSGFPHPFRSLKVFGQLTDTLEVYCVSSWFSESLGFLADF